MKGKKTGGRVKGTPNKATAFNRDLINSILSDYYVSGALADDLKKLEPKERADVMIKLAAFVTPKPQSIDMSVVAKKKTIEDVLISLSQGENPDSDDE